MAIEELPYGAHRYKIAFPQRWDSSALCTNLSLAFHYSVLEGSPGGFLQSVIYKPVYGGHNYSQRAWLKLLQSRAKLYVDWFDLHSHFSCLSSSCSSSSAPPGQFPLIAKREGGCLDNLLFGGEGNRLLLVSSSSSSSSSPSSLPLCSEFFGRFQELMSDRTNCLLALGCLLSKHFPAHRAHPNDSMSP